MSGAGTCDLPAYLARIGYHGPLAPRTTVLEALHVAHAAHIPFENLDILAGKPIALDLESLQRKLVGERRGGMCFEQNLLFAAVLETVGFRVRRLAARVRQGAQRLLPRTHMLLLVEADGATWLADVGFGADAPLAPVPFGAGAAARQGERSFRVLREDAGWVLQSLGGDRWLDLYAFTLEPQELVDYEMATHFIATHPASPFTYRLTAQLSTAQTRWVLRNRELATHRGAQRSLRLLRDDEELLAVLRLNFGLHFPAGQRFAYRDDPPA